jgi:hypothetical protein
MPDAAWKAFERWIASYLGGERVWKDQEDVAHPVFSIECKYRKEIPRWLKRALAQAELNAPLDKLPMVVLHEKNQKRDQALVVIRLSTFREWYS